MARFIILFFMMLFSFSGHAADSCGYHADQFALKPLNELQNKTCEDVKNSQECQQAYNQIKMDGGDPADYELQCKDRGQVMRVLENYANIQAGCALGGWNFVKDTFVGIGTAIGEGVAKVVIDAQQEKADNEKCDKDINLKKALFTKYNDSVPKLMKIQVPTDDIFQRVPCAQLKAGLHINQTRQNMLAMDKIRTRFSDPNAKYTADEKEYVDWLKKMNAPKGNSPSVVEMAKNKIHQMGIQYECYNTLRATAMVCEAMLDVGSLAAGGAGVALKVARIAGVAAKAEKVAAVARVADATKAGDAAADVATSSQKVEQFVDKVKSADRRGSGGVSQQITNQAHKDEILNLAGTMTNEERVASFESLAGRQVSSAEAKQIQKMHDVGSSEGRGYDALTDADLKAKAKLAQEINPETGKPYFTKEETDLLMRNGITGLNMSDAEKLKFYQKYSAMAKEQDYSQWHRLHAETASNLGKTDEAQAAYKKAYAAYVKENKVDFSNPTLARQKLANMSERELNELENLAAQSGNTDKLAEISKAKWNKVDKSIRDRYRNKPGAPQEMEATIHDAYNELRQQTYSSNPLTKKAAEEKLKALKATFPGLR